MNLTNLSRKEQIEYLELLEEKARRQRNFKEFASEEIHIINKNGERILFNENEIQKKINKKIEEIKAKGIPPRIIVLKARQEGVSTNEQARMMYKVANTENRNALIVAHDSKAVASIFSKAKYMYDNLKHKPLKKASNSTELVLSEPSNYKGSGRVLNSKIVVQVASGNGIARGDTFHYMHLSEFAFWEGKENNSPKRQLAGALASVPRIVDSWVVIESTANGFNDFKELWDNATDGNSEWTPMFFAWHDFKEYEQQFHSEEEKENFIKSLSEYELFLKNGLHLKIEKINWWHFKYRELDEDIDMMKQEFPSTPDEAFIASGRSFFDTQIIINRIEQLRNIKENRCSIEFEYKNQMILDNTITLDKKKFGSLVMYKDVERGVPYILAADTAGDGSDMNVAYVIDNVTGEDIAYFEVDNDEVLFAKQMYAVGRYYNNALVAPEINFSTFPLLEIQRLGYDNIYVRERSPDSFTGKLMDKLGVQTNKLTRPEMLGLLKKEVEENPYKFKSKKFFDEALTFIKNAKARPEAQAGKHDDHIMARAIAIFTRPQQSTRKTLGQIEINFDKLSDDRIEDYYNCKESMRGELIKHWKMEGII